MCEELVLLISMYKVEAYLGAFDDGRSKAHNDAA